VLDENEELRMRMGIKMKMSLASYIDDVHTNDYVRIQWDGDRLLNHQLKYFQRSLHRPAERTL
jgi:hypothetical protein